MARRQSIDIRRVLHRLIPRARLKALANDTGAVVRERKIGVVELVWTLVLGFATGNERTLAGLRRAFEKATGKTAVPSAFYDRFTPQLVRLLKTLLGEVMDKTAPMRGALRGSLACFKDVLLADSTVIRLHDLLQKSFPACRTNHTLAALKAHVILSVTGRGPTSIKVTSERVHDGPVLRAGRWVRDRLLIFDLGYYRFQLFDCIDRQGGYFLTRLKDNANPVITAVHRQWCGQAVDVVGRRLQDVIERLERQSIDMEVELKFHRRPYGGHRSTGRARFRLVGVRNAETGDYHLYITNIPAEKLSADDIARIYAVRWLIEMAFKQLKSAYRLDQMPSSKRHVVEALLYAALITMMASRVLLDHIRSRLSAEMADRLPDDRWAAVFAAAALDLLALVVRRAAQAEALAPFLANMLMKEAVDPNRGRPRLLARVEQRKPLQSRKPAGGGIRNGLQCNKRANRSPVNNAADIDLVPPV
jgi:putative transposase